MGEAPTFLTNGTGQGARQQIQHAVGNVQATPTVVSKVDDQVFHPGLPKDRHGVIQGIVGGADEGPQVQVANRRGAGALQQKRVDGQGWRYQLGLDQGGLNRRAPLPDPKSPFNTGFTGAEHFIQ